MRKKTHIDNGKDVKIILVDKPFNLNITCIVGQQIVGVVLGNHRCDPFSSVHRPVNDDGRLDTLSGASEKVYPCDGSTLKRISGRHNLCVLGMCSHKVLKEL